MNIVSSPAEAEERKAAPHVSRPEHHRDVAKVARCMRAMEETFDVVFVVEGQKFAAHGVLVSSASPMLRKMLYGGMREAREHEVALPTFKSRTWRATLGYILL